MHEMSLALALVGLVEDRARREGAARVLTVGVAVGRLGHVEPEALAFCLDGAARGTLVEGARFAIEERPGRAWCFDCAAEVGLERRGAPCPGCGGQALRVAGGEELRVTTMEIA